MMTEFVLAAFVVAAAPPDRTPDGAQLDQSDRRRCVLEWDGTEIPILTLKEVAEVCTEQLKGQNGPPHQVVRWLLRRGIARYYLGAIEEAAKDLRQACRLSPDDVLAKEWLAVVLAADRKTAGEASRIASELVRKYPERAAGYFVQAYLALHHGRYKEAEGCFTQVIARAPDKQSAFVGRAVCYFKLNRDAEFLRDIATARSKPVSLGTLNTPLEQIYGFALFQNGMISKALDVLLAARQRGNRDLSTLGNAWLFAGWLGKPTWCLVLGREMAERFPESAAAHRCHALALGENGRPREGIRILKRVMQREGAKSHLETELACLKEVSGDISGAVRGFEAALRKRPDDAEALLRLACLLATCPNREIKNPGRAQILARRACELVKRPQNRRLALTVLATAQAVSGERDKAVSTLKRAIQVHSEGIPRTNVLTSFLRSLDEQREPTETPRLADVRIPLTVMLLEGPRRDSSPLGPVDTAGERFLPDGFSLPFQRRSTAETSACRGNALYVDGRADSALIGRLSGKQTTSAEIRRLPTEVRFPFGSTRATGNRW